MEVLYNQVKLELGNVGFVVGETQCTWRKTHWNKERTYTNPHTMLGPGVQCRISWCEMSALSTCYRCFEPYRSLLVRSMKKTCNIVSEIFHLQSSTQQLSFEWSHFRISSKDSKVRTTFYSIVNSTTGKYCSVACI